MMVDIDLRRVVGRRDGRGGLKVLGPVDGLGERAGHVPDHVAGLDRRDPTSGERATVAITIDHDGDGLPWIARTKEVAADRVRSATFWHRSGRRHQRLRSHLTAEE